MKNNNINNINRLQAWAGLECTVNRIGDNYLNQMERSGHILRDEDISLFASLGIKMIRYPVLWELIAPNGIEQADWSWVDRRLKLLQEHQIEPIVGFCHHGSGPLHTSLVKPCFVPGLVEFARAFVRRYPTIKYFTPINEPLTTARFSTLYGHWYPHSTCDKMFSKALLNQCRAIIENMRAIREVNPAAKLVQTEDMGKTYSTPLLKYQAEYENERRWLSLDLLSGKLTADKPMWKYLIHVGVAPEDLQWFQENYCTPDIIGINHYPTSERFLDEKYQDYPEKNQGGNADHRYADVEMVRVNPLRAKQLCIGHYGLLKETWQRYSLPIAITEVHIAGGREDQIRWLNNAWNIALKLREEGVDICAVTAWSLLGSFDWCSLVTKDHGKYESGVFDIRSGVPRPTAVAKLLASLAKGEEPANQLVTLPGWWQRDDRVSYPFSLNSIKAEIKSSEKPGHIFTDIPSSFSAVIVKENQGQSTHTLKIPHPTLLILGGTGTLGVAFKKVCEARKIPYTVLNRQELDITRLRQVEDAIGKISPWAVINTTGFVKVDEAESQQKECWNINNNGPGFLADVCFRKNIRLVNFSSDMVFDGTKQSPYIESDKVNPLNEYGRSKASSERLILKNHPNSLIIRTSWFFGPWDQFNFITQALSKIVQNQTCHATDYFRFSPTYVPDLAHGVLDLLIDEEEGIWHLSNKGETNCDTMVRRATEILGLDTADIYRSSSEKLKAFQVEKPSYTVLGSERGQILPGIDDALSRYCTEIDLELISYHICKSG